jgi:hypothetical protein
MRNILREETVLGATVIALAGVSPIVFPSAQAGLVRMSTLAVWLLLPSIALLAAVVALEARRREGRLVNRVLAGGVAGVIATLGLEAVRITSFRLGGMPGDLPQLMGVLLTDRFMLGPSLLSTALGYAYHFWNGACFGIVFAVLLGRKGPAWAIPYGLLVGFGFLGSPAVKAMGVGPFALGMPSMAFTVVLAHLSYGAVLGLLIRRWVTGSGWLLEAEATACAFGADLVPGRSR